MYGENASSNNFCTCYSCTVANHTSASSSSNTAPGYYPPPQQASRVNTMLPGVESRVALPWYTDHLRVGSATTVAKKSKREDGMSEGGIWAAPHSPAMEQYLNMAVIKKDEHGNYVMPVAALQQQSVLYKYKTVMCKSWLLTKSCPYDARCKFAHGEHELRQMVQTGADHPKYKTKPCKNFTVAGLCPFGARCLFIHPTRKPIPQPPVGRMKHC